MKREYPPFGPKPPIQSFKSIETMVGVDSRFYLHGFPFQPKVHYSLYNPETDDYLISLRSIGLFEFLYYRRTCTFQCIGKYRGKVFEYFLHDTVFSLSDVNPLYDREMNTRATTKGFPWKTVETDEYVAVPRTFRFSLPQGDYFLQLKEYKYTVGFFDFPALPKKDMELIDPQGEACLWANVHDTQSPGMRIKIVKMQENMDILLSLFSMYYFIVSTHVPLTKRDWSARKF